MYAQGFHVTITHMHTCIDTMILPWHTGILRRHTESHMSHMGINVRHTGSIIHDTWHTGRSIHTRCMHKDFMSLSHTCIDTVILPWHTGILRRHTERHMRHMGINIRHTGSIIHMLNLLQRCLQGVWGVWRRIEEGCWCWWWKKYVYMYICI